MKKDEYAKELRHLYEMAIEQGNIVLALEILQMMLVG